MGESCETLFHSQIKRGKKKKIMFCIKKMKAAIL